MPKRGRQKESKTGDSWKSTATSLSNPSIPLPIIPATSSISPVDLPVMNASLLQRLGREFFDQPCVDLAKSLLGKILVRKMTFSNSANPVLLSSRIVETESYLGGEDRASHSFNGRRTDRNAAMFMDPGTCYVYMTYGMYDCFNISSRGDGSAVLIRAVQPLTGIEFMRENRQRSQRIKKRKLDSLDTDQAPIPTPIGGKSFKLTELCNGPSKLCMAMRISRDFNRVDLTVRDDFYVADDGYGLVGDHDIVNCARIGINNAGEWNTKPLRFYIRSNAYVSVKVKG